MSHSKHTKPTNGIFDPIDLRGIRVRNRVWLPPMCMYAVEAQDGKPTPFHFQHYVSRALGGFGMVITESTAVSAEGRISPNDCGLWNDDQVQAWKWIVDGIKRAGAVAAVQLNHAGRKASSGDYRIGFEGQTVPSEQGGWQPVGPSDIAFDGMVSPHALTTEEIHGIIADFAAAARRALDAGRSRAVRSAATTAMPEEPPTNSASSSARRRVMAKASASSTARARSGTAGS